MYFAVVLLQPTHVFLNKLPFTLSSSFLFFPPEFRHLIFAPWNLKSSKRPVLWVTSLNSWSYSFVGICVSVYSRSIYGCANTRIWVMFVTVISTSQNTDRILHWNFPPYTLAGYSITGQISYTQLLRARYCIWNSVENMNCC